MGAGQTSAGRQPPSRVEVLHETQRTRVTRLLLAGRTVIRKEPLGPGWPDRLRHELAILDQLRSVAGVAHVADAPPFPDSILLEDVRGVALSTRPMPLDPDELVRVAMGLARTVAGMHGRGVMHRDIGPANILLSGSDSAVCLVDFALASTFAEIRPGFTHHSEIVGTLPYLAPEQTGRTGRPIDQRADLYAVGATLYELATGDPPFGRGDALVLSHDVLARVPVAPVVVNPAVPRFLSDIVMHLLEKEPDSRYQTAEGLVHDLAELTERAGQRSAMPAVGERDFPVRLVPPSRLVGREAEVARLGAAFAGASSGQCRGVLVCGEPGVGKTTLIDELRPLVTAADGWFVAGKFEQYRDDQGYGLYQAFRAVSQLLLAEPEEELADVRDWLLNLLGPNAGLVTAMSPEFAALLGVVPEVGDPVTAATRSLQAGLAILRAAASRKRPLVLVLDDLQWASPRTLSFLDLVFREDRVDGLLVVAGYRERAVDAADPLTSSLARWRQIGGLEELRLGPLAATDQTTMVADMLRLDPTAVAELAEAIAPLARGNPYNTVELLNALRRDDILRPRAGRWWWDPTALHRYLATADFGHVLAARVAAMPRATQAMLQAMACLGGHVELAQLRAATGHSMTVVEQRLVPALDDGLLVMESGTSDALRFRHDRVQAVILQQMEPVRQQRLHLGMARRLATVPEFLGSAAQQYLPVVDLLRDAAERRRVAGLMSRAAGQAELLTHYPVVDKLLEAAVRLTDPRQRVKLIEMQTGRHAALFGLGRLGEADRLYATIAGLSTTPLERVDATLVQVSSLINRGRDEEALRLGAEVLGQLGLVVTSLDDMPAEIDRGFAALHRWLDETDQADDLRRPQITDPVILSRAVMINRMIPAAYRRDQLLMSWLTLQSLQILIEHGPGPALIGPAGFTALANMVMREDYRTGYRAIRRILALGEAHGYATDIPHARFVLSQISHWFTPLEDSIRQNRQAREGLIQSGDLAYGSLTDEVSVPELLDCTPSLDAYSVMVDSGLAFARRSGSEHTFEVMEGYRRLVDRLRSGDTDPAVDEAGFLDRYADNQHAKTHAHIGRAVAAAVFGDKDQLAAHTTAAMPMLAAMMGNYSTAVARMLHVLALTDQIHASTGEEREQLLGELDEVIDWLAARAADAPTNFLHLLLLAQAERAWAVGEFRAALHAFDAAQREASAQQRPWHRGVIFERTAQFYLADGMQNSGYMFLARARAEYQAWGATAKVDELDWAYPGLLLSPEQSNDQVAVPSADESGQRRSTISTGAINLLGVLSASQALSSETSVDGLRARIADVLCAMTGATGVSLLLRGDNPRDWLLSTPDVPGGVLPVDQAKQNRLVPTSVLRYAQRIQEPLVVNDAVHDDRFARDPYFGDVERCSLLAVPIVNRGELKALLLLENRLMRGAFSGERLGGIMLIASQLAVSLDNALIYASLERKVAQSTRELADANDRLQLLSITDPLTGLANRRRFEDVLDAEWHRGQRSGKPLALAMIDIDHFKRYNDRHGHPAGDRRLQHVAATLQQSIRDSDLLARYGGEEFAVVMPTTDVVAAEQTAERLRTAVMHMATGGEDDIDSAITISIGVAATVPAFDGSAERLIELADDELYRAKRNGRNRVCAADIPT